MLVTPPFLITAMEAKGINDGIFYTVMCYFVSIMSVYFLFVLVRTRSIFGMVDKEIFVWKYYGFANPQRFPMQELTRKEYYGTDKDGKPTHRIELFQKNILIQTIVPSAYCSETERIVELLRQIPGEIFKDKNFEKQEEIEKREERLQQILKEENNKNN